MSRFPFSKDFWCNVISQIEHFYLKWILPINFEEVQQNETGDQLHLEEDIATPTEVNELMNIDDSTLQTNGTVLLRTVITGSQLNWSHYRGCLCSMRTKNH